MEVAGEPFYRDLLRFSGRRRRGSYFDYSVALLVLSIPIVILVIALHFASLALMADILLWGWAAFVGASHTIVSAQRCRDFNWSGWCALLAFLPVIDLAILLVLFFYPGTRGPNRYGPDPLEGGPVPADTQAA